MTTVNMDIVELLLDCDNFGPDAFALYELRHLDGRDFTIPEHILVGHAGRAELQAVRDLTAKSAENAAEQHTLMQQMVTLMEPYYARFGKAATIGELRPLMTPDDRAQLDAIASRINGLA